MLVFIASLVAIACVVASARRLVFASTSTWIDPESLLASLRGDAGRARHAALVDAIKKTPEAEWERDLLEALAAPPGATRTALVNEQLTELDYRMQRWVRVPRVCASIATSTGFLLASLALRNALASTDVEIDVNAAVNGAINVAAVGIAGAAFSIAIQYRARTLVKKRMAAADKLVERLEALAAPAPT